MTFAIVLVLCAMQSPERGADSKSATQPTFYKDVLPILQAHCQSCHRPGEVAPMPLVTYEQTRPWASSISHAVEMKMMPPWFADPRYGHFANDSSLTEHQIATILAWAQSGAAAGEVRDSPPPRAWVRGWNIPNPDFIVKMPQAVKIPATGEVEYTYEIVPTHFAEDRWVQMSEFRAGSPAHVHHAVVYIRSPNSSWLRQSPSRAAVYSVHAARSAGQSRSSRDNQRSASGIRAGECCRVVAGWNGKIRSCGLRSCLPDALHDKRNCR